MPVICMAVLCGLPGAGKTTLAHRIQAYVVANDVSWRTVVVSYDELLTEDIEEEICKGETSSNWKSYRWNILTCVDEFLRSIQEGTNIAKPDVVTDLLWEKFSAIKDIEKNKADTHHPDLVVIIDDNMYYTSMRYQYYQLARKANIGFCELYVKCESAVALKQNARREAKVPEAVVVAMEAKLEPPDPAINGWERYALEISAGADSDQLSYVIHLFEAAANDPVQPISEEDTQTKEASRKMCSISVIHQSDQVLRKLVSREMSSAKASGKCTKDDLKLLSVKLSGTRTQILNDMKQGRLVIDANIEDITDAGKSTNSALYLFISKLFDKISS